MKKKVLLILLSAMVITTMFVGCGDTNKETTNSEIAENTEDDVLNLVPETSETPETVTTHKVTLTFPEGMEGYTTKYVPVDNESWSYNQTHYVDINGNVMNFMWNGSTGLGEGAGVNKKTLSLYDNTDKYVLRAFTTGELSPETYDEIKSYDKETIISFAAASTPYVPNGYYNANIGDTYMSFTYAVAGDIPEGGTYMGYEHYIMDREKGLCYQFSYLENASIYDDERALKVIESLDFWNMESIE